MQTKTRQNLVNNLWQKSSLKIVRTKSLSLFLCFFPLLLMLTGHIFTVELTRRYFLESHEVKCSFSLTHAWVLREGDVLTERRLSQVCREKPLSLVLELHNHKQEEPKSLSTLIQIQMLLPLEWMVNVGMYLNAFETFPFKSSSRLQSSSCPCCPLSFCYLLINC